MNAIKLATKIIPLLALAAFPGDAQSRQDHWIYLQSLDDFAKPLGSAPPSERPDAKSVLHFRRPRAEAPPDRTSLEVVAPQDPDGLAFKQRFTSSLLISMKKADRIPARTLARCELEMDECFKERLGRGFFVARASEACRVEDVCLLPVSLDYAQFTLVSRMIKANADPKKRGNI